MDKIVKARFKQRADTAANWTANNPVLLENEIGYENNTGKYKFGDGKTKWNNLKSYGGGISSPFEGATSSLNGNIGLVPAPQVGDQNKFLCADGTWKDAENNKIYISSDISDKPLVWLEAEGVINLDGSPWVSTDITEKALVYLEID